MTIPARSEVYFVSSHHTVPVYYVLYDLNSAKTEQTLSNTTQIFKKYYNDSHFLSPNAQALNRMKLWHDVDKIVQHSESEHLD